MGTGTGKGVTFGMLGLTVLEDSNPPRQSRRGGGDIWESAYFIGGHEFGSSCQAVILKDPLLVSPPPVGTPAGNRGRNKDRTCEALGPTILSEGLSAHDLRTSH